MKISTLMNSINEDFLDEPSITTSALSKHIMGRMKSKEWKLTQTNDGFIAKHVGADGSAFYVKITRAYGH